MIKKIFGKNYKFQVSEDLYPILCESTELYKSVDESNIDVFINITTEPVDKAVISRNPSIHSLYPNGLHTKFGIYDIYWQRGANARLEITFHYTKSKGFKSVIRKYRHMECPSESENFEQVLHELVLVPSSYFFEELMPIHASTVCVNGKTIMFAGTGGVGKSSAMLAVKDIQGSSFVADDITVVNSHGNAFGNMAWPKIYGYNCTGTTIADLILDGRNFLDKVQFKIKNQINPSAVRRKIKPNLLYSTVSSTSSQVDTIYYLFKENVKEITVSDLENETIKKMTISVIESEYSIFHNHINWHQYNILGANEESGSIISMDMVKGNWGVVLDGFFSNVKRKKISIPLDIGHTEYLKFIKKLLVQV